MADFTTLEKSVESSRPAELYEFILGGASTYRYTSSSADITIAPNTWVAQEGISRNSIVQGGSDSETRELVITLPADNEFVEQYQDTPPGLRSKLKIYRIQRDETPSIVPVLRFTGVVLDVRYNDSATTAAVVVRSIETGMKQRMPRYLAMGSCNNYLYDALCGIDSGLHNIVGAVTAASGSTITVTGVAASSLKFASGIAKLTTEQTYRMVVSESGDVLTLDAPFDTDVVGQNMQVFAGCDHKVDGDCALVYNNVKRFIGHKWVSSDNPFRTGINV